jgi:hypothetical protein
VSESCNEDALTRQHTIALVLRIATGPRGELSYGEIVDSSGRVKSRFRNWQELTLALQAWLKAEDPA